MNELAIGGNVDRSVKKSDDRNICLRRRRFVQGIASGGVMAALGTWGIDNAAFAAPNQQNILNGTNFDLTIANTAVNFTGKQRDATTVNGLFPGPTLRMKEGTAVTIKVTNLLDEPTSIHWHGLLLPFDMDGVPGISFPGIEPGETFVYRFKVQQSGTYWYHSHSKFQEQTGLFGSIIIDPQGADSIRSDRDYVLMLNDWTDQNPEWVFRRLKQESDFFNYQMPTAGDFFRDVSTMGFSQATQKWKMWNQMRMNPTDLGDVSGATFTYLANGMPPNSNWTALAAPGQTVRLRIINGAATTIFDVRIPGLKMTVVSADGQDVEPVEVDEFRISVAETYDVLVKMPDAQAYTIFAQSIDRSGYTRGTLAPRIGMSGPVPEMDPKTWLSMVDMGMGDMAGMTGHDMSSMSGDSLPPQTGTQGQDMGAMKGHDMSSMKGGTQTPQAGMQGHDMPAMKSHDMSSMKGSAQTPQAGMQGHDMSAMKGHDMSSMKGSAQTPKAGMEGHDMSSALPTGPSVDSRAIAPSKSLSDPGPRLRDNGRRVLTYADLRTVGGATDKRPPSREITLRLTGNMNRFIWGFDGKKFSEAEPVYFNYGERLRITLINDSMMNHPIHLHGMFSDIENEEGQFQVRKHTVNAQPGKQISFQVTADAPGQWAFHCHLLYHMEAGMFRMVVVR
jgi:CopA family copper-resistance protein